MANSPKDPNFVNALLGVLNSDGRTVVKVLANPTTHVLSVLDGNSGSDNGPTVAQRDENNVPTLLATSSLDGTTIVPVYADSNGQLLIDSN